MSSRSAYQHQQSRPSGPDVFDEEACRDFLYALGLELPAMFTFEAGIEEVYKRMVAKYCKKEIGEPLGLLYELLEDESSADGKGDDGDVWRSWRYAWRHRADDLSNPGTPRNIGFILPTPAPKAVRDEKAKRFRELSEGVQDGVRRTYDTIMSWATADMRGGHERLWSDPEVPPSSIAPWQTPHTVVEETDAHDKILHCQKSLASLEGRGPPLIVANFENLYPEREYSEEHPPPHGVTIPMLRALLARGPEHEQASGAQTSIVLGIRRIVLDNDVPEDLSSDIDKQQRRSEDRPEFAPVEKENEEPESAPAPDLLLLPATIYRPPPPTGEAAKPSLVSNALPHPHSEKFLLPPVAFMPSTGEAGKSSPKSNVLHQSKSENFQLPAVAYEPPPTVRVTRPSRESNVLAPPNADNSLLRSVAFKPSTGGFMKSSRVSDVRPQSEELLLRPIAFVPPVLKVMAPSSNADIQSDQNPGDESILAPPALPSRDKPPKIVVNQWRQAREAFLRGGTSALPKVSTEEPERRGRQRNKAPRERPTNLGELADRKVEQDAPRSPSIRDIIEGRSPRPRFWKEVPYDLDKFGPEIRSRVGDRSPEYTEEIKALLGETLSSWQSSVDEEVKSPASARMSVQSSFEVAANDDDSIYSDHDVVEERVYLDPEERTSELYKYFYPKYIGPNPDENLLYRESPSTSQVEPTNLYQLEARSYVPTSQSRIGGTVDSAGRASHVWTTADLGQREQGDTYPPLESLEDAADQQDADVENAGPVIDEPQSDHAGPPAAQPDNQFSFLPSPLNEKQAGTNAAQPKIGTGSTRRKLQKRSSRASLSEPKQTVEKAGTKLLSRVKSSFTGKDAGSDSRSPAADSGLENQRVLMESDRDIFGYKSSSAPHVTNDRTGNQHDHPSFTGRSIDLDRELPALPVDAENQKFLTINTDHPSLSVSSSSNISSAKTSSSVARSSTVSSKKDFRHLTHGLMNPDSAEPSERLSAAYEPLEPTKFNPLDARKPLPKLEENPSCLEIGVYPDSSPASRQTRWPGPEMESRPYYFNSATCLPDRVNMPQSLSENNFRRIEDTQRPSFDVPRRRANSQDENTSDRVPSPTSPARGRFLRRSPSPTKHLEDLSEEDDMFQYSSSPSKRSRSPKKLFGEGGWLGRSPNIKEKKSGFKQISDKLKQGVEGITEGLKTLPTAFHNEPSDSPERTNSKFPVSLDPPTQARLYAEIELMICVTANKFLLAQYDAGRTSLESVKKITEYWTSKNRPQVIEFQFDQATQRELILANTKTFEFYGKAKENPIVLNSVMYNWRVVAKEMSIRTFCTPDSVVRKHMHDVHQILEMLGAPLVTFLAFQDIQISALDSIKKQQEKKGGRRSDQSGRSGGRVDMLN